MSTAPRITRTAIRQLLTLFALTAPSVAHALEGGAASRLVDLRAENRIQVLVTANAGRDQQVVEDRIGRDLLAYHFRLDAVDANGNVRPIPATISLVLRIGTDVTTQVTLSRDAIALALPRPFAIRVGAEDALGVSFVGEAEELTLRVTIDYEPIARERTRLPVRSIRADLDSTTASASMASAAAFSWKQPVDGRMLAISGMQLDRVATISLVDVDNGETLWSTDLRGRAAGGDTRSAALRLGAPVTAGRTYRIDITLVDAVSAPVAANVLAVVMPTSR